MLRRARCTKLRSIHEYDDDGHQHFHFKFVLDQCIVERHNLRWREWKSCRGERRGGCLRGTYSNSFTQESDTSSSVAVNQTTAFTNKWFPLTGPALDHGNDVIYVWVNPQVWYTINTPSPPIQWNGYTYDQLDDSNNMEVIPIRLSQLLNPSTKSSASPSIV